MPCQYQGVFFFRGTITANHLYYLHMKLGSTKQNIGNTHKIPRAAELALLCYFVLLRFVGLAFARKKCLQTSQPLVRRKVVHECSEQKKNSNGLLSHNFRFTGNLLVICYLYQKQNFKQLTPV